MGQQALKVEQIRPTPKDDKGDLLSEVFIHDQESRRSFIRFNNARLIHHVDSHVPFCTSYLLLRFLES